MRKITEKMMDAFNGGYDIRIDNTEVRNKAIYLHGHRIAWRENGKLYVQAVFDDFIRISNTTKRWLNALNGVSVCTIKKQHYLNGVLWDGKKTEVKF